VRKIGPALTISDPLTMEKYIQQKKTGPESDPSFQEAVKRAIDFVCDALVANENVLNQVKITINQDKVSFYWHEPYRS